MLAERWLNEMPEGDPAEFPDLGQGMRRLTATAPIV
jgi:hypothetical protein